MKRSMVNKAMKEALALFSEYKISLPDFLFVAPDEWKNKGDEVSEIIENELGWDITDFGLGEFDKKGLFLITLRNGSQKNPEKYPKPYAEKLMIVKENQVTLMHYHWYKMEDIINRGGGDLVIKLYNSTEDNKLADTDVSVSIDGVRYTFPAGHIVRLKPGQSITLTKGLFHSFWAEGGAVVAGEVSMCNDDANDNCFYEPVGRYSEIEEDEPPLYLLCNEYNKWR